MTIATTNSTATPNSDRALLRRALMEALGAMGCVGCIVMIALFVLWGVTEHGAKTQMRAEVARLAASTTAAIDPVLHDRLRDPSHMDTPLYEDAIRQLRRQLDATPGVKYMYTAVLDQGKVRFVLDPSKPGDHDGDGREDRAQLWEEYSDAEEIIRDAFGREGAEPRAVASDDPYTDEWGTFVSGYAPVKRADGSVAAVVGVDIDAAEYMKAQHARWKTSLLAMIPAVAMSLGVGAGTFVLRRQHLRALRDAEQTGEDAGQWASMLAESESRFRLLADASPVMIWTTDVEGRFDYFNKVWLDFRGHSLVREAGTGWREGIHQEDAANALREMTQSMQARTPFEVNLRLLRVDGVFRNVLLRGVPRHGPDGSFVGFAGVCLDMTEIHAAEASLRENQARTRLVIDTAMDGVVMLDASGLITEWNALATRIFGYSSQEAIGRDFVTLVLPGSSHSTEAVLAKLVLAGRIEIPARRKSGEHITIEVSMTSMRCDSGKWYSAFLRDVSDRKSAELAQQSALRLSTRLARARTFEDAGMALNDALENMTGLPMTAVIVKLNDGAPVVFRRGLSEETVRALEDAMSEGSLIRHGRLSEVFLVPASVLSTKSHGPSSVGSVAFLPIKSASLSAGWLILCGESAGALDGRALDAARAAATYMGVAIGRIHALEQTRKSEELFRVLTEASDDLVDLCSPEGRLLYVSPSIRATLGTAYEAEGVVKSIDARDQKLLDEAHASNLRGERAQIECRATRSDGTTLWLDLHAIPVLDSEGRVVNILHSARDVTARKLAAEALARARAEAESSNRTKTEFLANMSHEIRTPLTAILGYTDLLSDPHNDDREEIIATIKRAGDHLMAVVNDVLDISKIEAGRMTTERVDVSLGSLLLATEKLMRPRAAQKQLDFRMQILDPLPSRSFTDPTRLRQILLNLMGNAVKFTEAGHVHVRVRMMRRTPVSRLVVEIEDSGQGLSSEQASLLFQPFAQADASITRRHGGTGLGLTISRQLARLLGGEVLLQHSELGKGSIFRLEIDVEVPPDCDWGPATESADKPAIAAGQRLSGRILLAEDGIDNQRLISRHLTRAGAEVTVAENGRIALDLFLRAEENANRFDMIVTDMQMPEMDGYVLAETLRTKGFSVPILALTAHAMVEDRQRCLDCGCDEFVTKPIDSKVLISTCSRLMSSRNADLSV